MSTHLFHLYPKAIFTMLEHLAYRWKKNNLLQKLLLLILGVPVALQPPLGHAGQELWSTKFPLDFNDGTKIPEPFATKEQFDNRLKQAKAKYEPFTRNLAPQSPYMRPEQNLAADCVWLFRDDSQAVGETQKWFLKDINEAAWSKQKLPDYRQFSLGWYRTTFAAPAWSADRIILKFEGVDYSARVFLNEQYIGQHIGYAAAFEFDITALLKPTGNVLAVRVDNPESWDGAQNSFQGDGMGTIAFNPDRGIMQFSNAAGIFQPVKLIGHANIHTRRLKITPQWPTTAMIEADIFNVEQQPTDLDVQLTIFPKNFAGSPITLKRNISISKEISELFACQIPDVHYWSPDTPYLYTARLTISDKNGKLLDCADESFGMRWLSQQKDGTFLLNNEPFYIRGSSSFGTFWPAAVQQDANSIIADILLFKAANLDITRPHLHTLPKYFYQYADMYGLMIYLDLPINGAEGFGGNLPNIPDMLPAYIEEIKRQFHDIVETLYNNPSVVIWQFINESQIANPAPQIPPALKEAVRYSREIDPTRLVCASSGFTAVGFPTCPNKEWWGISDIHWYQGVLLQTMPFIDYHQDSPQKTLEFTPADKKIVTEYGIPGYPLWQTWAKSFPWELPNNAEDLYDVRNIPKEEPVYRGLTFLGDVMILGQITRYIGDCVRPTDWIRRTQDYQAYIVKGTTDILRRRPDISGYAHFYLTNPGPLTFGSAIVDNERLPHKAYYALAQASEPLRTNIQCDGQRFFDGTELTGIWAWIYNDTKRNIKGTIRSVLTDQDGKILAQQQKPIEVLSKTRGQVDTIVFKLPAAQQTERRQLFVFAILSDANGILSYDCLPIETFTAQPARTTEKIALYDKIGKTAAALKDAGVSFKTWNISDSPEGNSLLIIGAYSSDTALVAAKDSIAKFIEKGGSVLVLNQTFPGQVSSDAFSHSEALSPNWHLERAVTISGSASPTNVSPVPCDLSWLPIKIEFVPQQEWQQTCYVQRHGQSPLLKNIDRNDLFTWNGGKGLLIEYPIDMISDETVLTCGNWQDKTAVLTKKIGLGKLLLSQLILVDRHGVDPIATRLFNRLLDPNNWSKTAELSIVKTASLTDKQLNVELTITNPCDQTVYGDIIDPILQDRSQEPNLSQFRTHLTLRPKETKVLKFSHNLRNTTITELPPAVFVFDDGLWICSNMPTIGIELDTLEKFKVYDFGAADSPLANGAIKVVPDEVFADGRDFGWNTQMTAGSVCDNNALLADFHMANRVEEPRTFKVKLPKGNYCFRLLIGTAGPSKPELFTFDIIPPQIILCDDTKVGRLVRIARHQVATLLFTKAVEKEQVVNITLKPLYPCQIIMLSALEIYKMTK